MAVWSVVVCRVLKQEARRTRCVGVSFHVLMYDHNHSVMPDGWAASAGGFPAMVGNVAFLMKDVVLLAVSFYLLKQDTFRLTSAGSIDGFENIDHRAHQRFQADGY